MPRRVVLFGANGRLGGALRSRFAAAGGAVQSIPWSEARAWIDQTGEAEIRRRMIEAGGPSGFDVLFAGGNTNPAQPPDRLMADNLTFVVRVVEAAGALADTRFVSFGTVLEDLDGLAAANPYAQSKRALADWVEQAAQGPWAGRIGHVRLHTLYGGEDDPPSHMFLGQMLAALRARRPFAMSDGRQLREYHHVEDVAGTVGRWLDRAALEPTILTVSSGRPLRLADLARTVFERIGRPSDLSVGALTTHRAENFDRVFTSSPAWLIDPSRDPLDGVAAWIAERLNAKDPQSPGARSARLASAP